MPGLYRLCDSKSGDRPGVFPVAIREAHDWNKDKWGIFWTINEFNGPRRIENLTHINCWAVDLDTGTKEEQKEKIASGAPPSMVIESKNGFHVYWRAKDAKKENWNAIMLDRLVPFYGADKRARDLARLLRAPNYYHWKDPNDPFLIKQVWQYPVAYTEATMAWYYPVKEEMKKNKEMHLSLKKEFSSDASSFFERLWEFDCEEGLSRLSGLPEVNNENYSFRQNTNGKKNIYVNSKSTSCFLDTSGRIGSLDGGGPTLFQWLKWYGHSNKETYRILKKEFPEL